MKILSLKLHQSDGSKHDILAPGIVQWVGAGCLHDLFFYVSQTLGLPEVVWKQFPWRRIAVTSHFVTLGMYTRITVRKSTSLASKRCIRADKNWLCRSLNLTCCPDDVYCEKMEIKYIGDIGSVDIDVIIQLRITDRMHVEIVQIYYLITEQRRKKDCRAICHSISPKIFKLKLSTHNFIKPWSQYNVKITA